MGFLPFGFVYPKGHTYSESNPDPVMEKLRKRMQHINDAIDSTSLPGHIFCAALSLMIHNPAAFSKETTLGVIENLTQTELIELATTLAPRVSNEPIPLDFPNAIPLVDCRFVTDEEWRHIRQFSIGGSEVAAILGISPFQTKRSLYRLKTSTLPTEEDISTQQIFDYGHILEDYVVEKACGLLGAKRYPEYRMWAHRDYPNITCNPDALLVFPDGSLALFEAKTANYWKLEDWKQGIPAYYVPQPRQYLAVLNDPRLTGGYIGCCLGGDKDAWACHSYTRDLAQEQLQLQAVSDYWNNHVIAQVPPELSGDVELDMEAVYSDGIQAKSSEMVLPKSLLPLFEEYQKLDRQKIMVSAQHREAEKKEKELLRQIRERIPDGYTIVRQPGGMSYLIKVKDYIRCEVDQTRYDTLSPAQKKICLEIEKRINATGKPKWNIPTVRYPIRSDNT